MPQRLGAQRLLASRLDPQRRDPLAWCRPCRLEGRALALREKGVIPRIEAVVAAQDPSSLAYVAMKRKWAGWCAIESGEFSVTEDVSHQMVMDKVAELNADPAVHGVLIQHPLPGHIDEPAVLESLGAAKDVDGITSHSLGLLTAGLPGFRCATPLGPASIPPRAWTPVQTRAPPAA